MKLLCISTALYGHAAPLLSIAKAWQTRGAQVVWIPTWGRTNATCDLLSAEKIIVREVESFRLERIAPALAKLGREKRKQYMRTWMMPGSPSYLKAEMWWRVTRLRLPNPGLFREQVEEMTEIIRLEKPVAILTESFSIQGVTASQVSGVPFACQHLMFSTTPDTPMTLKEQLSFKVMQLMMRGINRVRRQLGLSASFTPYIPSNRLNLVGSIPSYMQGFIPTDEIWQCVGPLIWDRTVGDFAQEESSEWLDDWLTKLGGLPFVYLSLGTTINDQAFFDLAIDAFAQANLAVLMTLGPYHSPINSLPPNIRLVRWYPQGEALARATAAVIHGGQGTSMGCIAAGVPAVVVPFAWDQMHHAARFVALDCGIRLNRKGLAPQQLRTAVEQLLTKPSFKTRAQALSDEIAQYEGPERACDLIEQQLIGQ